MTAAVVGEEGSASLEMVLITPVLAALLLFVVAVGRLTIADGEVEAAARDAARAAAIARSIPAAIAAGTEAAGTTLADRGVACRQLRVDIDTREFRADGIVRARVACTVDLEAVTTIGLPGSKTLAATFSAPVDRYRALDQ